MEIIKWKNIITYKKEYINKCKLYLGQVDMLPLYKNDYDRIVAVSKQNDLILIVMLSLRSLTKVQIEIDNSKISKNIMKNKILNLFEKFVRNIYNVHNENVIGQLVIDFYRECKLPVAKILKTIQTTQDFKNLSEKIKKILLQPNIDLREEKHSSKLKANTFETIFEKWLLLNVKTKFLTENNIRNTNQYAATPDFLFSEFIIINVDDTNYKVRWIDVKNYSYIDIPFINLSLKHQSEKYNSIFGSGCFIFKGGFQSDGSLKNVLILDGTLLVDSFISNNL